MWGKQIGRIRSLRKAAAPEAHAVADLTDDVHLDVTVYATPMDGDLDGFVAGICDGLQPPHPNYLSLLRPEEWEEVPARVRPPEPVGLRDDRAITRISAERREPGDHRGYDVRISW